MKLQNKIVHWGLAFKPMWLMYFAGTVFVVMLWDLVFGHTGRVTTALLWQVCLMTLLFACTHYCCYTEGVLPNISCRKKSVAHVVLNYVIVMGCAVGFQWLSQISPQGLLMITAQFIGVYLLAFLGFSIYYRLQAEQLNEKLREFKKQ